MWTGDPCAQKRAAQRQPCALHDGLLSCNRAATGKVVNLPRPAPYEPPDGLVLIRDRYQFEGAEHPMTGLTPDGPGPHRLIVVLTGYDPANYPPTSLVRMMTILHPESGASSLGPCRGMGWSSSRRRASTSSERPARKPLLPSLYRLPHVLSHYHCPNPFTP